jgi:predicted ATP-dependent serine protease
MVATDWVIDDLISEKLTIIAGAPGVGKTTCLFGVFSTAAGFKDIGSPLTATFRRKILWVSEHPEQIQQLMEAISKRYVDQDGVLLYSKEEKSLITVLLMMMAT